jgi:Divergent InlB B-repeat domain
MIRGAGSCRWVFSAVLGAVAVVAVALGASPLATGAAAGWCGTVSTVDRPQAVAGYPIRVVYAVPSDGDDRSAIVAPQIAAIVDEIDGWWRREDSSRLPRFDLYSDPCGLQLDLTLVRIPAAHAWMTDFNQLFDLVWSELGAQRGSRMTKYLVFYDGQTRDICGTGGTGTQEISMGVGIVFLGSCSESTRSPVAAREVLRTLGVAAALERAPHACPDDRAHVCDSTGDVISRYAQDGIALSSFQLDVGHDDYYGEVAPMNLQSSPWLRHVDDQARLTLSITGVGRVAGDLPGVDCTTGTCATDWDRGSVVDLTPTAEPGNRFVRWNGACQGGGTCLVTLDAAQDVTALFAPATFRVRVSVSGRGVVTSFPAGVRCARGACGELFDSYEPVRLTAKPARGWRLASWAGACRGARQSCTLPMTKAASVRAVFVKR